MGTNIKWRVYRFTRPGTLTEVGVILAPHGPAARAKACQRWPDLKPSKEYPQGRARVVPVRKFASSPMNAAESELAQRFVDAVNAFNGAK